MWQLVKQGLLLVFKNPLMIWFAMAVCANCGVAYCDVLRVYWASRDWSYR